MKDNQEGIKSPFSAGSSSSKLYNYNDNVLNQDNNISTFKNKISKYNTSSDFIKMTYSTLPKTTNLKKQIKIPFALNFTPLSNYSDKSIPLLDYNESYDLPRCKNPKCQAFLNPFVEFINSDDQWKCNICKTINKVLDYYPPINNDNDNNSEEVKQNELNTGTYEYMAYKNILLKDGPNVISLNFFFVIDISQNAINQGFTQCVLESIKDCINNDNFYEYDNIDIKICIITYDELINLYPININKENENEQSNITMLSINETTKDLFLPTNKTYLLVNLKKYKNKLIQIIENIQNFISQENYKTPKESNRFFDALKICDLIGKKEGGRILIFNGSSLSKLELMNINNSSDINPKYKPTDGGKISAFGIDLSLHGICINVFQACKTYTNMRTINQLIINSNGNLFFYRNFSPELHYKIIFNQIHKLLLNQTVIESGLKLRFSHNISIKEYVTPVLLFNKNIIYFPNLDPEQSYSFILEMNYNKEEDLIEEYTINDEFVFLQGSLFYKRCDGKKIIRIFNLCFPVSLNPQDIYDTINTEFLGALYAQKLIMDLIRSKKMVDSVNTMEKEFFLINNGYFNNLNMIKKELSEEMKIYALYILGIFKNCLFNKNDKGINNDDDLTNFYLSKIQKFKIEEILCFIYPRIYPLDSIINSTNNDSFPIMINDNYESLINNGNIFLIDNGFKLILYFRSSVEEKIIFDLFEVNDIDNIDLEKINEGNVFDYSEKKSEIKNKIMNIIENIRNSKTLLQNLEFIFEGINDQKGKIILQNLIEDNYNRDYPYSFEKFLNKVIFE